MLLKMFCVCDWSGASGEYQCGKACESEYLSVQVLEEVDIAHQEGLTEGIQPLQVGFQAEYREREPNYPWTAAFFGS